MGNPSKDHPWEKIFSEYGIHNHDFNLQPFTINAQQIKSACQDFTKTAEKEVRILCYQANRKDKPQVFLDRGVFLLPIKNGEYKIVKGEGYTDIPEISSPPIEFKSSLDFPLVSSLVGSSEMQHLDYAHATGLIEHFVGEGKLVLTIRGRKYTPEFEFTVGKHHITQKGVQTEVDAGFEGKEVVVLIEAKNQKMDNIIIRQLYYPYRKWGIDTQKTVIPLFFEKRENEYMMWKYEFADEYDYNSLRLVKSEKYTIS